MLCKYVVRIRPTLASIHKVLPFIFIFAATTRGLVVTKCVYTKFCVVYCLARFYNGVHRISKTNHIFWCCTKGSQRYIFIWHMDPLSLAAFNGAFTDVQTLLQAPGALGVCDSNGYTPLHWASGRGHFPIVQLLVEAGADVNATATDYVTPLRLAQIEGHTEVINFLTEHMQQPAPV